MCQRARITGDPVARAARTTAAKAFAIVTKRAWLDLSEIDVKTILPVYDFVQKCINCFLSEGGIKKDSDAVFEEILLNLIYNLNGEQGLVMCFDCAPNNYCNLTACSSRISLSMGVSTCSNYR